MEMQVNKCHSLVWPATNTDQGLYWKTFFLHEVWITVQKATTMTTYMRCIKFRCSRVTLTSILLRKMLIKNLKTVECMTRSIWNTQTSQTRLNLHLLYHSMLWEEFSKKSTTADWKWESHFRMVISSDKSLSKTCRCCLGVFGYTNIHQSKLCLM